MFVGTVDGILGGPKNGAFDEAFEGGSEEKVDGNSDGVVNGVSGGAFDGKLYGNSKKYSLVGWPLGIVDGASDGDMEGIDDGRSDGLLDGKDDGKSVIMEGDLEGLSEGISDGIKEMDGSRKTDGIALGWSMTGISGEGAGVG